MKLHFKHLDQVSRNFMMEELETDIANEAVRISGYLNERGQKQWLQVLRNAILSGDNTSLEESIIDNNFMKDTILRKSYGKSLHRVEVPDQEEYRISEFAFNRYYARAICRIAIGQNSKDVEICRLREFFSNQYKLNSYIGTQLNAKSTLAAIRNQQVGRSIERAIGLPMGSGGWTLKLID